MTQSAPSANARRDAADRGETPLPRQVRVGVLFAIPRMGGGSYQWFANVLDGLEAYAVRRGGVTVHLFFYGLGESIDELRALFPHFHIHVASRAARLGMTLCRQLMYRAPFLLPFLRAMAPLNRWLARVGVDLMLFPTVTPDSSLCACPHVFFLGDISHVLFPYFPEVSAHGERRRRDVTYSRGLQHAGLVVVESAQLKQDIQATFGVDQDKVHILHQTVPITLERQRANPTAGYGAAGTALPESIADLPARYLFYPAQMWPHKNHQNLLRALHIVHRTHPDVALVLAGSSKPGAEDTHALVRALGLVNHVHALGYVPDAVIPLLYQRAAALVMPTYFGPTNLPTLEAFYYGCPAVISDLPGVEEQTADAALRFDPDSPEDMAAKILAVLEDGELRAALVRRGRERLGTLSRDRYHEEVATIMTAALAATGLRTFSDYGSRAESET